MKEPQNPMLSAAAPLTTLVAGRSGFMPGSALHNLRAL